MALKIPDTLKSRLLALLLLIALAGLSSGLLVRELIVKDFRAFISGRLEDRTYWVMARLEEKYAAKGHWDPTALTDDVVLAYMMGLAVRISDTENHPIIEIRQAVEMMPPQMKKRVFSYAKGEINADFKTSTVYPLFHKGQEIGQLEVLYTSADKDHVFVTRSNRLLVLSLFTVGSLTLLLSILLSRWIAAPVERLTSAAQALRDGDTAVHIKEEGTLEFRTMASTFNQMADTLSSQESLRKKLLTNVAHELRTPLTVMRLQVEQMADGMVSTDHERLTLLLVEMDRFRGILGALEDLSQAEANSINLKKESIILRRFLGPIVERFVYSAQEISFSLDVPEGIVASADPERLSQIMLNLISNAIKAIGENGRIAVRAWRDSNGVMVSVEDSGCGIKEEDLPLIFERFYRGFQSGMGVGLAIVKQLVEAHGGTITVANNSSGGARFQIFIPD